MNADEYLEACLKTWTTDWTQRAQIAHAAMTLADEWRELRAAMESTAYDSRGDVREAVSDELGDVCYAVAILQDLIWSEPYLPECRHGLGITTLDDIECHVLDVHEIATKLWRSEVMEHYDAEELHDVLRWNYAMMLGDYVGSIAGEYDLSMDEVLRCNSAKLDERHN